jgi:outer membrane autotransporter protein
MKLRWGACGIALLLLTTTASAEAQGLNEVLGRLLSNGCSALGGISGNYGGQLADFCGNGGGAATATGGTSGSEVRAGGEEQRSVYRRLRQRQGSASADTRGTSGFSLFASADYQKYDQDTNRFESGFERDTVGGSVGGDFLFRNGLVLGAAFTYAHEFGDYDGVGGGFDHDAYGFLLYGSVVPVAGLFIDGVAGYTRKDYGFERKISFTSASTVTGQTRGDTEGDEFKVGFNAGYDFIVGPVTIGPRVGLLYRETTIDGFRESGRTGLELAYDDQNIRSLTSTLGVFGSMAISTGVGVIVPQASFDYVHEFLDDQRSVGFRIIQDLNNQRFLFETDRPDRNYFNLGVGVSMVLPNGMQPFLNFRELLGYRDRSSHTVTAGLRIPF